MLDKLILDAMERQGFRSLAELSRALGLSETVVCQYRRRSTIPSDEIVVQLALMGGNDPLDAITGAMLLRARTPGLRKYYEALRAKVIAAAALLFVASVPGGTHAEQITTDVSASMHYATWRRRLA